MSGNWTILGQSLRSFSSTNGLQRISTASTLKVLHSADYFQQMGVMFKSSWYLGVVNNGTLGSRHLYQQGRRPVTETLFDTLGFRAVLVSMSSGSMFDVFLHSEPTWASTYNEVGMDRVPASGVTTMVKTLKMAVKGLLTVRRAGAYATDGGLFTYIKVPRWT
ncbi:hypothetical protein C8Q75DRAFT_736553 [Abortiporus biennis]|nr:hypothetical protein C8Q75DRAFT_736553 [Abortiporus biennis]